jgi:hypothetical protein
MSKKTNAAKQKARTAKPRKGRGRAKGKHPNPGFTAPFSFFQPTEPIELPPGSAGPVLVTTIARQIGYVESFYVLSMWNTIRKSFKSGQPDPSLRCAACGISAAQAHETSMGLLCPKTDNLKMMHDFKKPEPVQ